MTNPRWFSTDYVEEKCEEFVLLSEHKPEKAVRKIWPLLVWFLPVCSSSKWDSRRFYTTRCHSGLAFKAPFAFSGIATYRSSRTGPGFLEDWEYRDPHVPRA